MLWVLGLLQFKLMQFIDDRKKKKEGDTLIRNEPPTHRINQAKDKPL